MWPWGHLAVGYLLYSPLARTRFERPPDAQAILLLTFGTQFPDLVDKLLAWELDVLPAGRTLAHSLLTVAVVTTLVYAYSKRRGSTDLGLAFAVGYVSHPFADALFPLLNGQYQYAAYLFWPLFGLPSWVGMRIVLVEPLEVLLGAEPIDVDITIHILTELALVALAVRTWRRDGAPAVAALRNRLDSTREPGSGSDR
jgi:membrane-bound metal-dependent hydrolase YbcI (DUF457 family)